jgi:hypothetical protein
VSRPQVTAVVVESGVFNMEKVFAVVYQRLKVIQGLKLLSWVIQIRLLEGSNESNISTILSPYVSPRCSPTGITRTNYCSAESRHLNAVLIYKYVCTATLRRFGRPLLYTSIRKLKGKYRSTRLLSAATSHLLVNGPTKPIILVRRLFPSAHT